MTLDEIIAAEKALKIVHVLAPLDLKLREQLACLIAAARHRIDLEKACLLIVDNYKHGCDTAERELSNAYHLASSALANGGRND